MTVKKAHYLTIAAPANYNKFILACDVFEKGKVVGLIQTWTATFDKETELSLDRAGECIRQMGKMEPEGIMLTFLHLVKIEIDERVTFNDGSIKPYWNKSVRAFSNGTHWAMLHDFIRKVGFNVKTDEHMFVTEIL